MKIFNVKIIPVLFLALFVTACADPSLDGTSSESFGASFDKMKEGLSESEQRKLLADISEISSLGRINVAHLLSGQHQEQLESEIREQLHGMSYNDIKNAAYEARLNKMESRRDGYLRQIIDYEEKISEGVSQNEVNLEKLNKLTLSDISLEVEPREWAWGGARAKVSFTLVNGSEYSLTKPSFDVAFVGDDGELATDKFSFSPQELRTVRLQPGESVSIVNEWDRHTFHGDMRGQLDDAIEANENLDISMTPVSFSYYTDDNEYFSVYLIRDFNAYESLIDGVKWELNKVNEQIENHKNSEI